MYAVIGRIFVCILYWHSIIVNVQNLITKCNRINVSISTCFSVGGFVGTQGTGDRDHL